MIKTLIISVTMCVFSSSCSKSNSNDNGSAPLSDYSGKYTGPTKLNISSVGVSSTIDYDMVVDVSKGESSNEIKILFGSWLTKATLSGTKFQIQETSFNGPIVTTGSGEFSGNKLTIKYVQKVGTSIIQYNTYTGTLTKL